MTTPNVAVGVNVTHDVQSGASGASVVMTRDLDVDVLAPALLVAGDDPART